MQDFVFMNGEMMEAIFKENDKLKVENRNLKDDLSSMRAWHTTGCKQWEHEYGQLYDKFVASNKKIDELEEKIKYQEEWEDKALDLIGKLFEENASLHQKVRDMDDELSTALAEVDEWKFFAEHPEFMKDTCYPWEDIMADFQ